MARPTKDHATRLSQSLPSVRCTEEEKNIIQRKAAQVGQSVSEYLRTMALNGQIIIKHSRADFELTQQLRKLGVNLNQQTKKLNATGVLPVELKTLWNKLEQLLDKMME